jgi:broad specificity phosphatase PhoE
MKPDRILLVRHGQSEGNVDKTIYKTKPDYAVELTEKGHQQAVDVGAKVVLLTHNTPTMFYVSPFWRTRQTFLNIAHQYEYPSYVKYYEDPRLREQEWGQDMVSAVGVKWDEEKARETYGHFYYRFGDGESCADVLDRMSDFMGTLFRDFQKEDFPRNVVIVSHGMAIRLFIMRWFHASVEEFESWANPRNCEHLLLERGNDEKYTLVTPMRLHKVRHDYQFDWSKWSDKPHMRLLGGPRVPYCDDTPGVIP